MGLLARLRGKKPPAASAPPAAPDAPAAPLSTVRAEALIAQGHAREEGGDWHAALATYEAAVALAPTLPRAHLNLGNARLALDDIEGALQAYRQALRCDPGHAGAYFNLGNALARARRPQDALQAYETACRLDGGFADAHVARGCLLEDLKRFPEAVAQYEQALAIAPGYAQVHSNLGNALKSAGRFEEALRSQRRALALDPVLIQAHSNLGNALKDLGRLVEAEASYRRAVELAPDHLDARSNLLFLHNYSDARPPGQLLDEARAFGDRLARRVTPFNHWACSPQPERALRIGLVSGDLRDHPVGYFLESVVAALTRSASNPMSVTAYATSTCDDATAARIKASCDAWRDVGDLSGAALAQQIHRDATDILIDLSGHTAHNRLEAFAWKPSPVQATWLGYFATTGVAAIDYLIADPWTLPESLDSHFTERIWRLPDTRLCFTRPEPSPDVSDLPATTTGCVTFGCFNNLSKVTPSVVALWARVLHAVTSSRLLLKAPQLQASGRRAELVDAFVGHGIDPGRLLMEGLTSRFDYLARYRDVDIGLDPFPFPGGTTSVEALWMGVPVLTLSGETFLSRQGVGILTNAGLADWVAADADAYVALAASHAADLGRLRALREGLRARMAGSPIMDAPRFAGRLQDAFRSMWRRWCRSQPA